jgi:DUF2934 family protein
MRRTTKETGSRRLISKPSAVAVASLIEPSDGMWARISLMAYELWEQRGRREGNALQDWLDAEAMLREDMYEARQ